MTGLCTHTCHSLHGKPWGPQMQRLWLRDVRGWPRSHMVPPLCGRRKVKPLEGQSSPKLSAQLALPRAGLREAPGDKALPGPPGLTDLVAVSLGGTGGPRGGSLAPDSACLLRSHGTLRKLFNHREPEFPHLQNWNNISAYFFSFSFFPKQGLTLSPTLEYSGTIIVTAASNCWVQSILLLQPPE